MKLGEGEATFWGRRCCDLWVRDETGPLEKELEERNTLTLKIDHTLPLAMCLGSWLAEPTKN